MSATTQSAKVLDGKSDWARDKRSAEHVSGVEASQVGR